jgi:hypothetical protein
MRFLEIFEMGELEGLLENAEDIATSPCLQFDGNAYADTTTVDNDGKTISVSLRGKFGIRTGVLKPLSVKFFNDYAYAAKNNNSFHIQCKMIASAYHYGFKYFNISAQQANMFKDIEITIPCKDIELPHNPLIISIPSEVKFRNDYFSNIDLIVYKNPDEEMMFIMGYVRTPSGIVALSMVADLSIEGETFESILKRSYVANFLSQDRVLDQKELIRIAVNTCLFATNYGFKKPTPKSFKAYQRLQRSYDKNKNLNILKSIKKYPYEMSFEQDITIAKAIIHSSGSFESHDEHGVLKPHWRRGHWHIVCYGEGKKLRKLMFYKPVFVNKDKFEGNLSDTFVMLKDKK